ncbi:DUF2590 family protein [Endozoicomonas lisbonensis]|uniref:Uncharacterized protein n=1 Tax=Endozoicomonas lisbonensis TaxID=3120522 RepID=A0ABV2SGZ7_9GAMM
MAQFTDIHITDRDLTLDVAGIPERIDDRYVIAQDLKHAILDTGILVELIAERSPMKWARNMVRLADLAEEDIRIIPGTVLIRRDKKHIGKITIFAETTLGRIALAGEQQNDQTSLSISSEVTP